MSELSGFTHKINYAVNQLPPFWLIFFLLCANHLLPLMTENEEMYFGLARQYIDPNWIPNSFTFTESPGTRLFFQWLIGPLLVWLPFEHISIGGQIICYGIYAGLLSKIFKLFHLDNILIFVLLQLLFISLQAFIGGEWIFRNFETKSIAYIFIFLSLIELLQNNRKKAILWTVPAFYFHVLVGGWCFIAIIIFFFIREVPLKSIFLLGCLFILLTFPWLCYLLNDILVSQQKIINSVNLDWVYTYFRNPHHTVTFHMGWPWFRKHRIEGMGMLLIAAILGSLLYPKTKNIIQKNAWLFCFATYVILWIVFVFSYFDVTGRFLKFYVYRIAGISFLLTLMAILSHLKVWLQAQTFHHTIYTTLLLCSLLYLPIKVNDNLNKESKRKSVGYSQVLQYLQSEGSPGQVVVCLFNSFKANLPRETRLEPIVSYKFVPSGTEKLYEWYKRLKEKEKVENNLDLLEEYCIKHQVSFIVSTKPLKHLIPDFTKDEYYIFKYPIHPTHLVQDQSQ